MADNTINTTFKKQPTGFATKAIHFGQEPESLQDWSIIQPIVTSTVSKHIEPNDVKVI